MFSTYQRLQNCGGVLFATTSSTVDSFNIDDGSWLSSWTCPTSLGEYTHENEPPAKKRKLSESQNNEQRISEEIKEPSIKRHDTTTAKQDAPAVIALSSTSQCGHVIVVTGEDKSIRVLEHDGRGHLRPISQRAMPKRPCAIAVTADDSTIICADKFGDVYSIPLLISDPPEISVRQGESEATAALDTKLSKPFVPAANDFTVHSIRNRRALQNQIRQKLNISEKSEPQFERKLLLGHVSMLTDIVLAEHGGENYIITSDRDEHIRISRGIPQAHIIEGYCLGHREFVSRICIPAAQSDLLISGGGDDYIYVWNWPLRKLIHKVNLRDHAQRVILGIRQGLRENDRLNSHSNFLHESTKIAVSKIKYMKGALDQHDDLIIVACEGIPALFMFSLQGDFAFLHYQNLRLQGNPLDLVVDSRSNSITVSVDNAHQSGSTHQPRSELDPTIQPLQTFELIESKWTSISRHFDIRPEKVRPSQSGKVSGKGLSELLYPIEKLRKTGSEE